MPERSPELDAAVRAIGGESDLDIVMPALTDKRFAHVIALAPETHHLVRTVAALCGGLTGLLDPPTVAECSRAWRAQRERRASGGACRRSFGHLLTTPGASSLQRRGTTWRRTCAPPS